ncbi:PQQ-dependent sugar dehydrogenase [Nocardiopsis exhalans]|uniref:PQQ-dependent sugar dehydrogenase n=1 Tax=Nocardiopsis exhalans TaxID=163604 RepID=A0ABY5DBX8_9ACTN|nr:PQQ-dependent sugar dehydrogenase [Nocardiopsis exhalans]USY20548.1 PQQ-dependent sugar dehydrogenase [Nocardiopsis exhalans]
MERTPAHTRTHTYTTRTLALLGAALLASACSTPEANGVGSGENTEPGGGSAGAGALDLGQPEDLATGFDVPWGIDFLPDGSALVAQRDSAVVARVAPDGQTSEAGTIEGVAHGGEGGLLGLAVDPEFPEEPYVYVYYTTDSDNRVSRVEYDGEADSLGDPEVILDGIPAANTHNGGRIEFGPDGYLYAATGDAQIPDSSQDTDSLAGKILRMTTTGDPAPDNPFDNYAYSYGHRNVQGLAWDEAENLYATEFGQDLLDEVNLIEPGNNYGWPEVEGPGGGDEYTDPLITWEPAEASPSGAAIAGDSLYVASLRGARLWEIPLNGDGTVGEPEARFVDEFGRLRTVVTAPDGDALWLSTSNLDAWGSPADDDDRVMSVPLE